MQVVAGAVLGLTAGDGQFILLHSHFDFVRIEAGYR
jgi:hypothetical protein